MVDDLFYSVMPSRKVWSESLERTIETVSNSLYGIRVFLSLTPEDGKGSSFQNLCVLDTSRKWTVSNTIFV
jgi:hypothetical protein